MMDKIGDNRYGGMWLGELVYGAEKAYKALHLAPIPTLPASARSKAYSSHPYSESDAKYRKEVATQQKIVRESNARQAGKMVVAGLNIDCNLIGADVKVSRLDSADDTADTPAVEGTIIGYDFQDATIKVSTADGSNVVPYAEVRSERDDSSVETLVITPLIELHTDRPYKY
jgi:hypothetical protein